MSSVSGIKPPHFPQFCALLTAVISCIAAKLTQIVRDYHHLLDRQKSRAIWRGKSIFAKRKTHKQWGSRGFFREINLPPLMKRRTQHIRGKKGRKGLAKSRNTTNNLKCFFLSQVSDTSTSIELKLVMLLTFKVDSLRYKLSNDLSCGFLPGKET